MSAREVFTARVRRHERRQVVCYVVSSAALAVSVSTVAAFAGVAWALGLPGWAAGLFALAVVLIVFALWRA